MSPVVAFIVDLSFPILKHLADFHNETAFIAVLPQLNLMKVADVVSTAITSISLVITVHQRAGFQSMPGSVGVLPASPALGDRGLFHGAPTSTL